MGKNLIQQRRGKGSIFKVPKHTLKGRAKIIENGIVKDIITSPIHSAPLLKVTTENGLKTMIAPEGVRIGDSINSEMRPGCTLALSEIPEGTLIYNIEKQFGDGGKLVRASGTFARIAQKTEEGVSIILPSKKTKIFKESCRATIGVVAGGGRVEKPLMKAGNNYHKKRAAHKQYPIVCGISMNAVAHPHGSKSSHIKGRPMHVGRNAPPGRKVGKIAPSRTGMKR